EFLAQADLVGSILPICGLSGGGAGEYQAGLPAECEGAQGEVTQNDNQQESKHGKCHRYSSEAENGMNSGVNPRKKPVRCHLWTLLCLTQPCHALIMRPCR